MKKCFKILSVLLFAISLCACGNSQLNDNNVNNENKQEKFELKGKWYGQEDHCIEFLDDKNAIFNCGDIKDYQLKYIYNEDLNTIELKWTMSLNIEIKNDNGTYYLEETTPPQGYNKLTTDRVFTISGSEIFATFTSSLDDEQQSVVSYDKGSGIHIENRAGATMPETGGVGKTMFIAFGTLAAIGTGVLLITKKRMSMFED